MASPTDNSRVPETEPLLRRDERSNEPTSSAWDNLEALLTTHTRAWTPFLLASILVLVLICSALLGTLKFITMAYRFLTTPFCQD
jgi:hypothetical protein